MWMRNFTVKMGILPEEKSSFKIITFSKDFETVEFNPKVRK